MGQISIQVVDEQGRPLELARVSFPARVVTPVYSGEEGPPGKEVVPHLVGVKAEVEELAVRTDRDGEAVLFERPAPKGVGVGAPLVVLRRAMDPFAITPFVDFAVSSWGWLLVRVDLPGYLPQIRSVRPGDAASAQPLRVEMLRIKGPVLRGRALDSQGRLLVGALIEIRDDVGCPVLETGHTDAEGKFEIPVKRTWRFLVTVHPTGVAYEEGDRPVTLPLDTALEQDVPHRRWSSGGIGRSGLDHPRERGNKPRSERSPVRAGNEIGRKWSSRAHSGHRPAWSSHSPAGCSPSRIALLRPSRIHWRMTCW